MIGVNMIDDTEMALISTGVLFFYVFLMVFLGWLF